MSSMLVLVSGWVRERERAIGRMGWAGKVETKERVTTQKILSRSMVNWRAYTSPHPLILTSFLSSR
jgi:hypothetical protein